GGPPGQSCAASAYGAWSEAAGSRRAAHGGAAGADPRAPPSAPRRGRRRTGVRGSRPVRARRRPAPAGGGRTRARRPPALRAARRRGGVDGRCAAAILEPSARVGPRPHLRQAPPAATRDALAARVQRGALPPPAGDEPAAPRRPRDARPRERSAAPRPRGAPAARRPAYRPRVAGSMKLACVIHRYGAEVTGGSEAHCRAVAQRLAARHDVTVLTSCAKDYVTWRDEYPPGASMDGAVRVIRFRVARTRNLHEFRALSELVFSGRATEAEQRRWFEENGPLVPDLIRHLAAHGREYDRILFWSYRYYPSFCGLPQAADRAILVPTAEEDPLIRASILPSFFARPRAYLFLTPEEADLVRVRLPGACPPSETIGI